MRFRTYKNADLTVSEVGFGLWTISTGWWENFTEGEAIRLMQKASDLGITLFSSQRMQKPLERSVEKFMTKKQRVRQCRRTC
jgi:aryl-alcohol dehydrogenase-like predicted oxidoreductase